MRKNIIKFGSIILVSAAALSTVGCASLTEGGSRSPMGALFGVSDEYMTETAGQVEEVLSSVQLEGALTYSVSVGESAELDYIDVALDSSVTESTFPIVERAHARGDDPVVLSPDSTSLRDLIIAGVPAAQEAGIDIRFSAASPPAVVDVNGAPVEVVTRILTPRILDLDLTAACGVSVFCEISGAEDPTARSYLQFATSETDFDFIG